MPIYPHRCSECDRYLEEFRPMSQAADLPPCPECDAAMPKDWAAIGGKRPMMQEYAGPIEMLSLAVNNDEDIAAFRARNPNVEIGTDRSDPMRYGVPVATTRREKLAILKAEGYVETN